MNKRVINYPQIHPKEHSMRSFPTVIDGWGGWLVFIFCTKQWRIDQSVPWQMRGGSHSKNGKKSNLWDCFILISCLYLERCEVNLVQKLLSCLIKEVIDVLTLCSSRLICCKRKWRRNPKVTCQRECIKRRQSALNGWNSKPAARPAQS